MKRLWLIVLISTGEILLASESSAEFLAHKKVNADDTDRLNVGATEATAESLQKAIKKKGNKAFLVNPATELGEKGDYYTLTNDLLEEFTFAADVTE
jgi:hypothetical protein